MYYIEYMLLWSDELVELLEETILWRESRFCFFYLLTIWDGLGRRSTFIKRCSFSGLHPGRLQRIKEEK